MRMIETPIAEFLSTETTNLDESYRNDVLRDFWICCVSREASILGRKEVLGGKAKFGIFGDGKEVPQVAMARAFKKGDWRSGYYRDQTFIFALDLLSVEEYFSQIYADPENEPMSGGRQMNGHFGTPTIDENGEWLHHKNLYNSAMGISSTAGQMARSVGLALASKKFREYPHLSEKTVFSKNGNEVCFCTIGDASTSEGAFWESVNAAAVLKIPLLVSVWDDGYGISVPTKYQTTKGSISEALKGFRPNVKGGDGMEVHTVKAWDYPALVDLYEKTAEYTRETHTPALIHVQECTQQLGHSTSGSHERYKSKERLQFERDKDCIKIMGEWMVEIGITTEEAIQDMRRRAKEYVRNCKNRAWANYYNPVKEKAGQLAKIYESALAETQNKEKVQALYRSFKSLFTPVYADLVKNARQLNFAIRKENLSAQPALDAFLDLAKNLAHKRYHTELYSSSKYAALNVPVIPPVFSENSKVKNGYEVANAFFDKAFQKYPNLFAFGEDTGKIGGVNQSMAGLQEKHGEGRVFDTGIREWTIMGQAIGMALRGLRPIAEIQYLDYLIYGLSPLSDDLATLRYRSNGIQQAPAIIRTRGHRLEGIWHSGSPIGMLLGALRGMYLCVPRDFVQAAGMYNTLLHSDDPALVIECLNGYRLKEKMPDNIGEYTVPLGVPEVLIEGTDITLVTYGTCVRVAKAGIQLLQEQGISVELIDVQTLLPFDLEHRILQSLKKTNRIVFMDEDLPGGATSYMMQEVLEKQGGYRFLDSAPVTLTSKEHRPPYGTDGDYFSKPHAEDVFEVVYEVMREVDPERF
ncbi:MAG TPA: transketolase [Bacteroidetes bacterium]|nr:transketolase [Bacteroidota bacterium]